MDLFRRKIELNAGGKLLRPPLTIHFDVDFDDTEKIDTATIKVYNLSDSTISGIIANSVVTLSAGYEGDMGVIFKGVAKNVKTTWQGPDKITEIGCIDETGSYLTKKITKTFAPGTAASVVLKYLVGEAGLSMGDFSPPTDFIYRKGKTLKGNVSPLLKAVAKDTKSKMRIGSGKMFIRDPKKGDATGFVLNKESGLIDHPEPIETEEETKDKGEKKKRSGYKLKMLLNHRVKADSIFVVQSKAVNKQLRAVKGTHTCNGRSFYTICEVY
ncbi:phage protein [Sporosarcina sp. FSL K6-1508]|uniref:phage protein n=1 Tax=Sporosarcina sp. FSL K6-1508 TaxID=2921553 RepID=UPI0030FBA44D